MENSNLPKSQKPNAKERILFAKFVINKINKILNSNSFINFIDKTEVELLKECIWVIDREKKNPSGHFKNSITHEKIDVIFNYLNTIKKNEQAVSKSTVLQLYKVISLIAYKPLGVNPKISLLVANNSREENKFSKKPESEPKLEPGSLENSFGKIKSLLNIKPSNTNKFKSDAFIEEDAKLLLNTALIATTGKKQMQSSSTAPNNVETNEEQGKPNTPQYSHMN